MVIHESMAGVRNTSCNYRSVLEQDVVKRMPDWIGAAREIEPSAEISESNVVKQAAGARARNSVVN
jgi:hypothetical protein